jgi:hypothetical protein
VERDGLDEDGSEPLQHLQVAQAHGFVDRVSKDVDLFTTMAAASDFPAAGRGGGGLPASARGCKRVISGVSRLV